MKENLHPDNIHRSDYDFELLCSFHPELKKYIQLNPLGKETINFFDSLAVKSLNKALLKTYYKVKDWDIPADFLCPPIPGRADYIHYLNEFITLNLKVKNNDSETIKVLDVGTGANVIYPLIGNAIYKWNFIGSELNEQSFEVAKLNIQKNNLQDQIEIRKQNNPNFIFKKIIQPKEQFHLTLCNPPFHASKNKADEGSIRKLKNLTKGKKNNVELNFGGQNSELWCEGGEVYFIIKMITESVVFKNNVLWFSTLISKKESIKPIEKKLQQFQPTSYQFITMQQGNKVSRFLIWSFR